MKEYLTQLNNNIIEHTQLADQFSTEEDSHLQSAYHAGYADCSDKVWADLMFTSVHDYFTILDIRILMYNKLAKETHATGNHIVAARHDAFRDCLSRVRIDLELML